MPTHPLPAGKLLSMAGTAPCFPAKGPPKPPACTSPGDTQLGIPRAFHRTPLPSVRPTHIFEGEDDGSDDPGHHDHDAQHTEQPRTRCKINLMGTHTYVTGQPRVSPAPLTWPTKGRAGCTPLLALVWKQKMVTTMATMAVMSMAIRTAFVLYMLQRKSSHTSVSSCQRGTGDPPPQPPSWTGTSQSLSPRDWSIPWPLAASQLSWLRCGGQEGPQIV